MKKIVKIWESIMEFMRLEEETEVDVTALNARQQKRLRIVERFEMIYKVYIGIMFVIMGIIFVRMATGNYYAIYFLKGWTLVDILLKWWMGEFIAAGVINLLVHWWGWRDIK